MSSPTSVETPLENFSTPSPPLRRLTFELFAIITLKIAALLLIWWLVFAPQPTPDTSAGAMAQRLPTASHVAPDGRRRSSTPIRFPARTCSSA